MKMGEDVDLDLTIEQILEIAKMSGVEIKFNTDGKHYIKNKKGEYVELDPKECLLEALYEGGGDDL
jgi:hypothetical protein